MQMQDEPVVQEDIGSDFFVTDWDRIFSQQANIDSFVGWKVRKGREFNKLREELKPLIDAVETVKNLKKAGRS